MICVKASSTTGERKGILDFGFAAGARKVFLIEEPMAAGIGADLPINEAKGLMIIDIGGGTTEIAIISLGGIVFSKSIRIGGNEFDNFIILYLKKNENIIVGEITAEQLKIGIG
jgi:Actin-like ATPase involved in cell morphogenesis